MRPSTNDLPAQQAACYERLRRTLLEPHGGERCQQPLAYWTLPSDRRLPQALLGLRLSEILALSFEEIAATRGIGPTKIESLFVLLSRAASGVAPGAELFAARQPRSVSRALARGRGLDRAAERPLNESTLARNDDDSVNPAWVSEALWQRWQADVNAARVADLPIGQVVPALAGVPTVLWPTALATYASRTLAEIRAMRTHGVKRLAIIMQAFRRVHQCWQEHREPSAVRAALVAPAIAALDRWTDEQLQVGAAGRAAQQRRMVRLGSPDLRPDRGAMKQHLAAGVAAQLALDCGEPVAQLVRQRLGLDGQVTSVRGQARQLGVTRARVYQLFERCAQAMEVRWPQGCEKLRTLDEVLIRRGADAAARTLLRRVIDLCYPAGDA